MKKNLTKRTGVLLLVLVMLTSCFVGGTFAKYVTEVNLGGSGEDGAFNSDGSSARVARWGVNAEIGTIGEGENAVTSMDLFKKQYATLKAEDVAKIGAYSVVSTDYVVAPGTGNVTKDSAGNVTGGAINIDLSGTPEVAGKIDVSAQVGLHGNWNVGTKTETNTDGFYCPLIFYVGNKVVDGLEYNSLGDLNDALSEAVNTYYFEANKDLAVAGNLKDADGESTDVSISIGWEWPFETDHDTEDTALGNAAAAAAETTNNTDDDIFVSCTANVIFTQID